MKKNDRIGWVIPCRGGFVGGTMTVVAIASLSACQIDERGREVDPRGELLDALDDAADDIGHRAPLHGVDAPGAVPGKYIVVFDKDISDARMNEILGAGAMTLRSNVVEHTFTSALRGFSGELSAEAVEQLRDDADVAYIEADRAVRATAPPWGLDRIDQRELPLDGVFDVAYDGTGVHAYVIDTGILSTHDEFAGRIGAGMSAAGGSTEDCAGHGTHVAGTIGGSVYGVAPGVTLHAVRVLGCSGQGTLSSVIAGIDWVRQNAQRPAVANMSLGGGASWSVDEAVRNAIAAGITVVAAAGNENRDACGGSPGRVDEAITVGATVWDDTRWYASNWGGCVDLMAPGHYITSAWASGDTAVNTISGTSMASPHVAGVVALMLQAQPDASPYQLAETLVAAATPGVLSELSGSPNRLLSATFGAQPEPEPEPEPDTCPDCASYEGTLEGTGDAAWEPAGEYYWAEAGEHEGRLQGPAENADFDLFLYRWDGQQWVGIASSESATSDEAVHYDGQAGYYVWRVQAYAGGGDYQLSLRHP